MKKKNKTYCVNFKVTVDTTVEITADSFENALIKAREFNVRDVVEFDTDYNDGSIAVIGIFNFKEEPK